MKSAQDIAKGPAVALIVAIILALAKVIGGLSFKDVLLYGALPTMLVTLTVAAVWFVLRVERWHREDAAWRASTTAALTIAANAIREQQQKVAAIERRAEPPTDAEMQAVRAFADRQRRLKEGTDDPVGGK
jgi:hypothetical protein